MCRNMDLPIPCINCSCSLPFIILEPHGWRLSPTSFWQPNGLLERSSYSCALQLIGMIKTSRKELHDEGLRFLSRAESREFHLDQDYVLDGYAPSVVQSLVQRGIVISQIPQNSSSSAQCSIYHYIAEDSSRGLRHLLWLADLLFINRFKDVDHRDSSGATPLMVANREYGVREPAFTLWLLDHGADPLVSWLAESQGDAENSFPRAAHMLLCLSFSDSYKVDITYLREIIRRIAPLELFDVVNADASK